VQDRQEMLDLLDRNLPYPQELGFDWRYKLNPAGQAWSWFLYEPGGKAAVAMTSLFPRKMYVDGKEMLVGQVMHFVVDAKYRSLGPAVLLQRATFNPVNSGELDFCYDCPPHDQGMSTFVRLGMQSNCEVIRYARLLRSDEYFANKIGTKMWAKPAVAVTNVLLRARRSQSITPGIEICSHDLSFDEEFSMLDRLVSSVGAIRHRRSAEELNYRHRANPEFRHRVMVARRRRELLAFIVFVQSEGIGSIVDLFGRELQTVAAPLLDAVIDICRRENMWALHGNCSEGNELASLFVANGFRPRERAARVVAYARPDSAPHELLGNGMRWSFSRVELLG
jgi:hypothetical protein